MSLGSALWTGSACALPLVALLAGRYLLYRGDMDGRARRAYLGKAAAFAGASLAVVSLIASAGERLALPAHWAVALSAAALALLGRALRGPKA
jgi:hypothetical protein